jgi:hypothetical protein
MISLNPVLEARLLNKNAEAIYKQLKKDREAKERDTGLTVKPCRLERKAKRIYEASRKSNRISSSDDDNQV